KDKYMQDKIPYEFTENDIEEHAIERIISKHTHKVYYRGRNNVTYDKSCIPKNRDIDVKEFISLYLPIWKTQLKIKKQRYTQEFYSKGKNQLFVCNDLKKCKICEKVCEEYESMSLCPECGRVVCRSHRKIDY